MREHIEQTTSLGLFFLLVFGYLAFYGLQIPFITHSTDAIVFAVRSLSNLPITEYAYLDERSRLDASPLPNYHLGHTVALWLAYRAFPSTLSHTIWPAGLVSAVAGALCAGLTYLIWRRLGRTKATSFAIAAISGLLPPIWGMSVVGEIYALQLLFTLLFLLSFLANRLAIATLAFLFSVLVSPIAGLSLSLVLLASPTKDTMFRAGLCGAVALVLYLFIMHLLGIEIWRIFGGLTPSDKDRSVAWKLYASALMLCLNINVLFPSLVRGLKILWLQDRARFASLAVAISPWLLLPAIDSQFLQVRGEFFLLVFWAISLPIGLDLTAERLPKHRLFATGFALMVIYAITYHLPNTSIGLARANAGNELRTLVPDRVRVIGPWDVAVPLVVARYGWDLNELASNYLDTYADPLDEPTLLRTGEQSLLVTAPKQDFVRRRLTAWGLPWFSGEFRVQDMEGRGTARKIFENEAVMVFRWDRGSTAPNAVGQASP